MPTRGTTPVTSVWPCASAASLPHRPLWCRDQEPPGTLPVGGRTDALLAQPHAARLKIRYEHRADIHLGFLPLGCALISLRFLGYPRPTRENGRPGPPRTASAILGT